MTGPQEHYSFHDNGQDWTGTWHPPDLPPPVGRPHGSAAVCVTLDRRVVLVSETGESWGFPGGRPEAGEDWRAVLVRELLEEACVRVDDATLLGYFKGVCIDGPEKGLALVRSLWRANVAVLPWEPKHEIAHRRLVAPDEVLGQLDLSNGMMRIHERWLGEALDAGLPLKEG